jgi:ankyrin repeat protein
LSSRQKESHCLVETAQFQLANACLQYLSTTEICITFSGIQKSFPKEFHFLGYAAAYWPFHAVHAERGGGGDYVTWPSQMMLNTWVNICRTRSFASTLPQCPNEGTTLMHIASEHGLERLAKEIYAKDIATLSEVRSRSNHISAPMTRKLTKNVVKDNRELRNDGVRNDVRGNHQRSPRNGSGMRISHRLTKKVTQTTQKSGYNDQGGSQAQEGKKAKMRLAADVPKEQSLIINAVDLSGQLPIHSAAGYNNLEMVKFLHERGSDLRIADQEGCTPLYKAVLNGHLEVVKFLYEHGADGDVHTATNNGWTPLNAASDSGHLQVLKFLYEHGADADIHTATNNGWTPLNAASDSGHLEVVKFLYEHGADADIHTATNNGWTPLHSASGEGHLEVVKFLYDHGADADLHASTDDGQTPLHAASRNDHLEVVKFLY